MVGSESAAHILNVHSLATAREADQVGEQHRHDLALFALRHFAGRQLRATGPAEAEAVWVPLTTRGADRHRSSLGPHRGKRPAPYVPAQTAHGAKVADSTQRVVLGPPPGCAGSERAVEIDAEVGGVPVSSLASRAHHHFLLRHLEP